MRSQDGELSQAALRTIGGLIRYAPVISAFGNTVASSYLRLVPNQEAPTKVCWSFSNRSSLVRIPLSWTGRANNLEKAINPQERVPFVPDTGCHTVELRSPDGSAHTYLLLAAIATAVLWGQTHAEEALDCAQNSCIEGDVLRSAKYDLLQSLPHSCAEAADLLQKQRHYFEDFCIFPPELIDCFIRKLQLENDRGLSKQLSELPPADAESLSLEVMHRSLHRH